MGLLNGIASSIGRKKSGINWSSYWTTRHPELATYIEGLATSLSVAQIRRLGEFLEEVKTELEVTDFGDAMDTFYLLAGETEESTLRNLVKDGNHIINEGAYFSKSCGYIGNGVHYLSPDYSLSADSEVLERNSSSAGIFLLESTGGSTSAEMGCGSSSPYFIFQVRYPGNLCKIELSNNFSSGIANIETAGLFVASRQAAANYHVYRNGSLLDEQVYASGALKNLKPSILGYRKDDGAVDLKSTKTAGCVFFGRGLTPAQVGIVTTSFLNYFNKLISDVYAITENQICAQRNNKMLAFDGTTLYLSTDYGVTFPIELETDLTIITFAHIFANGNIIFADHTRMFLSTDGLATYSETTVLAVNGNPYVAGTLNNFRPWVSQSAPIIDGKEVLVWGSYTSGGTASTNAWYSVDNGITIKSCWLKNVTPSPVSAVSCAHIHAINYNPTDESFWMQTGDGTDNCWWIKGEYNTTTDVWLWTVVAGDNDGGSAASANNTYYKTVGMVFKDGYVYWGSDSDDVNKRGIYRVLYDDITNKEAYARVYDTALQIMNCIGDETGIIATLPTQQKIVYSSDFITFKVISLYHPAIKLNASLGTYVQGRNKDDKGFYLFDIYSADNETYEYPPGPSLRFKIPV